jgi:hypothetical protein
MRAEANGIKESIAARNGIQPVFIHNYLFSSNVTNILCDGHVARCMSSVVAQHKCIEIFRHAESKNNVILWSFGSHALSFSASNTYQAVRQMLIDYTWPDLQTTLSTIHRSDGLPLPSLNNTCFILVGTPDLHFEEIENIDSNVIGSFTKFYQNSWRVLNQNMALRSSIASVRAAGMKNVHFLDIFPQTLALHFDGHYGKDPVHFSPTFYKYFALLVSETVKTQCVW